MRLTLIASALLLFATAATSHGQQAKYCNNDLVANSFYANVIQNGTKSYEVEYHGQFQNMDPKRQTLIARQIYLAKVGVFTVTRSTGNFELASYEHKDITLFRLQVTNPPAGTVAPKPAEIAKLVGFMCTKH